jgi:hypothetical protein
MVFCLFQMFYLHALQDVTDVLGTTDVEKF